MRELRTTNTRVATAARPQVVYGPLLAGLWVVFALATLIGKLLAS